MACALLQRGDWLGLRRCPTAPPSDVFGNRGTPPVPPAGAAPLHPAWGRGFCFGLRRPSAGGLAWRGLLSHRPTLQRFWKQGDTPCTSRRSIGFPAPSFERQVGPSLRVAGGSLYHRRGCAPALRLGNGGFVVACALLQRGDWLGLRRCPTGPPSTVFGNRGTRCTPGGGAAPAPPLGERGQTLAPLLIPRRRFRSVG